MFAEKNYKDGNFSREGYDYYLQLREQLLAHLPAPHVVLHLDVSAMVCFDRIHNLRKRVRARPRAARGGFSHPVSPTAPTCRTARAASPWTTSPGWRSATKTLWRR